MLSLRRRWLVFGLGTLVVLGAIIGSGLAEMDWPDRLAIQRYVNGHPGLGDALVDVGSRGRGINAITELTVSAWAEPTIRGDAVRSRALQEEISAFAQQHWRGEAVDRITVVFIEQPSLLAHMLGWLLPATPPPSP